MSEERLDVKYYSSCIMFNVKGIHLVDYRFGETDMRTWGDSMFLSR